MKISIKILSCTFIFCFFYLSSWAVEKQDLKFLDQAKIYENKKDYKKALLIYNQLLDKKTELKYFIIQKKAFLFIKMDKFAEAEYLFSNLLREKKSVSLYYGKALAFYHQNQIENALQSLILGLKLAPKAEAFYLTAKIYSEKHYLGKERLFTALDFINRAIFLKTKPEFYMLKSRIYEKIGKLDLAIEILNKISNVNKAVIKAKILLNLRTKNYKEAILLFNEIKNISDPQFLFYKAWLLYQNREYKKALKVFEWTNINQIYDPKINYLLALIFFQNKEYKKSIKLFTKILKNNLNYKNALINRADSYFLNKDCNKAYNDYKLYLKYHPKSVITLFKLAEIFYEKKKYRISIKYYKKILKINPLYLNALKNTGLCYFKRKKYKKALRYFLRFKKYEKNNLDNLLCLATTYAKLKWNKKLFLTLKTAKKYGLKSKAELQAFKALINYLKKRKFKKKLRKLKIQEY